MKDKLAWQKKASNKTASEMLIEQENSWQKNVNHLLVEMAGDLLKLETRVIALEAQQGAYIKVTTDKPRKHYQLVWYNKTVKGKKRRRR